MKNNINIILDQLINNDISSDEEIIEFLSNETGILNTKIVKLVKEKRTDILNHSILNSNKSLNNLILSYIK